MTETILEYKSVKAEEVKVWLKAAPIDAFPDNAGAAIEYKGLQIAIYNFSRRNEWFASQNLCPHKKQMILSRGMLGSDDGEPKVACPFHKKTFSLKTGTNLNGTECNLATYPVKVEDGYVYVGFSH